MGHTVAKSVSKDCVVILFLAGRARTGTKDSFLIFLPRTPFQKREDLFFLDKEKQGNCLLIQNEATTAALTVGSQVPCDRSMHTEGADHIQR